MTKEQFKTIPLADIKPGLRWYNEKHKTMYRIEKICYWESYDDTSIPFDNYQKAMNTEYLYLFENHFDFDGYGKDTVKFM